MRNEDGHHRRARSTRLRSAAWALLCLATLPTLAPKRSDALLRIDFEQKYFIHPGLQVLDFCLIRPDSLYHIYYIAVAEATPSTRCYALGHATSPDLYHWTILDPAVAAGPDWWDANSVWAPDVVPDSRRGGWTMLYTGVDSLKVQRACAAHSADLNTWTKSPLNPVFVPDSLQYYWSATLEWSSCRDPFLYRENGVWQMLSTAGLRVGDYPGTKQGIVHRSVSVDLTTWNDAGPLWAHDGALSWHDLESSQYVVRGDWHHLFFTEQDVSGVSHMAADSTGAWTLADRTILDYGNAAEIDEFDPGVDVFSRYVVGQHRLTGELFHVARFDTLVWFLEGRVPYVWKPHPLDKDFVYRTGASCVGQPTYGDNPVERGEPSCGLIGNGWFGSREYYQGPGSDRGSPGSLIGDSATGSCDSRPFIIAGDFIRLRVGGGNYPQTCYVALVDADADTVLARETGTGIDFMTERTWNVRPWRGKQAFIRIVDAETGTFGHINVDEIQEILDPVTDAGLPDPPRAEPGLRLLGAQPNPCNPSVELKFALGRAGRVAAVIRDARGRTVWISAEMSVPAGPFEIAWPGDDRAGRPVASGVYFFTLMLDGRAAAAGKLALVR